MGQSPTNHRPTNALVLALHVIHPRSPAPGRSERSGSIKTSDRQKRACLVAQVPKCPAVVVVYRHLSVLLCSGTIHFCYATSVWASNGDNRFWRLTDYCWPCHFWPDNCTTSKQGSATFRPWERGLDIAPRPWYRCSRGCARG